MLTDLGKEGRTRQLIAGVWTVTGTYQGLSDSTSLNVTHGYAVKIQLNPKTMTLTAGLRIAYSTTAYDSYNNSWDATSSATFGLDSSAGGSWNGNIYTSSAAGTWTVIAMSLGLSDTASLTVTHAIAIQITITPNSASITAGNTQNYAAIAYDNYNNLWDVSNLTSWSITSFAGGSWSGSNYASCLAGSWVITGIYSGLTNYAYLAVNHGTAIGIQASPKAAVTVAGSNESYTATASDSCGNNWDVTGSTLWTGSGGSWISNAYQANASGTWTITCSYANFSDIAVLTVNQGSVFGVTITPACGSVTAGCNQTFTATASDSNGNKWDVTNATTWSINSNAGGSWLGNIYTSSSCGNWTVTGTFSGVSGTTLLTVNHSQAIKINMGLSPSSVTAGSSVTLNATASDEEGNIWDITDSANWIIDSDAGGTLSNNVYTSELSGVWNVTVELGGLSNSVFLTVDHAAVANITVNPYNANIIAGSNEAYTATATDNFGNNWDVTDLASWSTTPDALGYWTGNIYTSSQAGTWTIKCTIGNLESTAPITVSHGSADNVVIFNNSQNTSAGVSQTFIATAYDLNGNSWDATNSTVWTINPAAGGFWSGNVYTSSKAGNWLVTGSLDGLSCSTPLVVNAGLLFSITISPANASITVGSSQTFNATASDSSGNTWDVTNSVNWITSAGAGGNWTQNKFTSDVGTSTVTCSLGNILGSAQITVNPVAQPSSNWLDLNHDGSVNFQDIVILLQAYIQYGSTGYCNPVCDFNHDGKVNFIDLATYMAGYITYMQTNH